MPKKRFKTPAGGPAPRKSAALEALLQDLESPDEIARAEAVRQLCPCRSAWGVPVQRYVAAMRDDPSSSVRHEVHHVLDEDSSWGERLDLRRAREEIEAGAADGEPPSPHSLAWRRRPRPKTGRLSPNEGELKSLIKSIRRQRQLEAKSEASPQ